MRENRTCSLSGGRRPAPKARLLRPDFTYPPTAEPWPDPVNGREIAKEIRQTLKRYVIFPEWGAPAVTLWVFHSDCLDAAQLSPILLFSSPEKRCGKTNALKVVGVLVQRPMPSSNITGAALFRAIDLHRPTLLIDEADTYMGVREEIKGILNSGHDRAMAYVHRCVGDNHELKMFSTWAAKAIALIGDLGDTNMDRSIVVRIRRKHRDEKVERIRLYQLRIDLDPLRRKLARWAQDHLAELKEADPVVPEELDDRAQDNWRPLLAIADLLGGKWPEQARKAATVLSGVQEDDNASARIQLLTDLKALFDETKRERIPSTELVTALEKMEDRPWPEWKRGKPITTNQLSILLKPFGIRPKQLNISENENPRGYLKEHFRDAWNRYLSPTPVPEPLDPLEAHNDAACRAKSDPLEIESQAVPKLGFSPL